MSSKKPTIQNLDKESVASKQEVNEHKAEDVSDEYGVHGLETEEGTFTPFYQPENGSFESTRYQESITYGNYYKVGNLVTIQCRVMLESIGIGDANGNLYISGLPYLPKTFPANGYIGRINDWNFSNPENKQALLQINPDGAIIRINGLNESDLYCQVSDMDTTSSPVNTIQFSATFETE